MIPRIPIVHLDSEVPNQPLEILLQVRFHGSTRFWIPMIPIAELDLDVQNQPLKILLQIRFWLKDGNSLQLFIGSHFIFGASAIA